ncbi:MAG TPA: chemotaxis-specific protein-glutamate methyltransferase CheB [Kofleriaceae bacterium]|nr:chemotaxis-specific protein-glutamate methyltransferase CheB [Kofleriaceae bacterium]
MTARQISGSRRQIRVLVVDDSALVRQAIRRLLERASITVVGECSRGDEAVERVATLRPDVITLDLDMPGLDGLGTIERIMADHPTPILVVTGEPHYRGLDAHFAALTRGAIDLVCKPGNDAEGAHLIASIEIASQVPVVPHVRGAARHRGRIRNLTPTAPITPVAVSRLVDHLRPAAVMIGASTGGPGVIRALLSNLGSSLSAPIVVAQHMADAFAEGFVRWLGDQVGARVVEATPGTRLRPGTVHVAVRGPHLGVGADGVLLALPGPATPHRPSIDTLFSSAAANLGPRALGVLCTGMGEDGAAGMAAIAAAGGLTIAQNEESSVVFGMPRAAIERGAARLVLPVDGIARAIRDACRPNRTVPRPGGASDV